MTDEKYWEYQRRMSEAKTAQDFDAIAKDLLAEPKDDTDVEGIGSQLATVRHVTLDQTQDNA